MNLTSILGILGGAGFAFAGIPAAWQSYRQGHTFIPRLTSWPIFLGVVFLYSYLHLSHGFDPIIAAVYGVEGISWAIVLWYTHFPVDRKLQAFARSASK